MIAFFIRRYNDIDHITPIVYKIAKENAEHCVIYCLNPLYDIYSDYRLNFLMNEYDIEIKYLYTVYNKSILSRIISRYYCSLGKQIKGTNNLRILPHRIFHKTLHLKSITKILQKYIFNDVWISNMLDKINADVLVFDHIKRDQYLSGRIVNAAQMKNISCIAVPHGIPLFLNDHYTVKMVKTKSIGDFGKKFSHFDHFIVQNKLLKSIKSKNGMCKNKIHVLGSTRYCKEWTSIHNEIINDDGLLKIEPANNKLKVVYMDTLPMYLLDVHLVEKTIKTLSNINQINLLIKPHTRSNKISSKNLGASAKYATDIPSIILCQWADVIIATSSSIMVEAYIQNKIFLYPKYLHKNTMLFEKYNACWETNSIKETKHAIEKIVSDKTVNVYTKENVEEFLTDAIYGGVSGRDVLEEYKEFIIQKKRSSIFHKGHD